MINVSLDWIAEQVNGTRVGDNINIDAVTTDSRSIQPGEVFLALSGERFDGHDYINDVVEKGASALIVSKSIDCSLSGELDAWIRAFSLCN